MSQRETSSADVRALFARSGLEPLLDARPRRRVERRDNREVWGPEREPEQEPEQEPRDGPGS